MDRLLNVLLVDDSKVNNKFNRTLISEMNIAKVIRECSSGKDALRFLKENKNDVLFPNIIFLDLVMPEMSGFSFLEKYDNLKLQLEDEFTPIVVILSDHIEEGDSSKTDFFPFMEW